VLAAARGLGAACSAHDSGGSAQGGGRRCLLGAAQDNAWLGAACLVQRDRRSVQPGRSAQRALDRGSGAGTGCMAEARQRSTAEGNVWSRRLERIYATILIIQRYSVICIKSRLGSII
jgi:hypothetical protein